MANFYRVRAGDTAASIAVRLTGQAGRWQELRAVNAARDWNRLRAGELIVVPASWKPGLLATQTIGALTDASLLASARAKTGWLTDGFFARFGALMLRWQIPPVLGLAVVHHESGIVPWRVNDAGCTGIMQWCPQYAPIPVDQIERMGAEEQLDLLEKWWAPKVAAHRGGAFTAGQVYAIVIAPAYVNSPDATRVYERPAPGKPGYERPPPADMHQWKYWGNLHLDHGSKGYITVEDFGIELQKEMQLAAFQPFRVRLENAIGSDATPTPTDAAEEGGTDLGHVARAALWTLAAGGLLLAAAHYMPELERLLPPPLRLTTR